MEIATWCDGKFYSTCISSRKELQKEEKIIHLIFNFHLTFTKTQMVDTWYKMKCKIQMNHIQVNDIFIIDIHIFINWEVKNADAPTCQGFSPNTCYKAFHCTERFT